MFCVDITTFSILFFRGSKWWRDNVQNQEDYKDEEGIRHLCSKEGSWGHCQWVIIIWLICAFIEVYILIICLMWILMHRD